MSSMFSTFEIGLPSDIDISAYTTRKSLKLRCYLVYLGLLWLLNIIIDGPIKLNELEILLLKCS